MKSVWSGLEGVRVYIECPEYHDVGIITDTFVDHLGVAWAELEQVIRIRDEDSASPTWSIYLGNNIRMPSTAVRAVQPAKDRWPNFKGPWTK